MKGRLIKLYVLVIFLVTGLFPDISFSQISKLDTNEVKGWIDSCRDSDKSEDALKCLNTTLQTVQQFLKTERRIPELHFLQKTEVNALRFIGNVYKDQVLDYPKAMEYYNQSLRKAEAIKFRNGIAGAYLNLGNIFQQLSDLKKALEYQQRSLKIFNEIKDKRGIGICLNNIGQIYSSMSNSEKALDHYQRSLAIRQEIEDDQGIYTCLGNIADEFEKLSDYKNAMEYYEKCLNYSEKVDAQEGVLWGLNGLGGVLLLKGETKKSESYFIRALILAKELGQLKEEALARRSLRIVFEKEGRYKEALLMNDSSSVLYDSIANREKKDEITKMGMQSDFDKKEALAKLEHEKKILVAQSETEKQRTIVWSVVFGLIVVVVFSIFIWNRWRLTQKQKLIIEEQKQKVDIAYLDLGEKNKIIEHKNKDITDSLTYAENIQRAVLPNAQELNDYFSDSFVLFKPKDIVSGDFYWFVEKNGKYFLAVCDSTGHGVPGAFMSLLNISFLNEAIIEKGILKPNEAFDHVRGKLIQNISKEGGQDGMDGILLGFEFKISGVNLEYACANNGPLIIRDHTIIELEVDKMPVGRSPKENIPFNYRSIELKKGDLIIAYTDGYADQFGGPKGKKFKYKQLNEMLICNSNIPLLEQKINLENTLNDWRGDLEQVDDICVIGIRI